MNSDSVKAAAVAIGAYVARQRVAIRHAEFHLVGAMAAEIH